MRSLDEEPNIKMLTAEEVAAQRAAGSDALLLDVRTEEEWESHHIPGAKLLPLHLLQARLAELDPRCETIVLCEHGIRSGMAARYLAMVAGFENVANMIGGMSVWPGPIVTGK